MFEEQQPEQQPVEVADCSGGKKSSKPPVEQAQENLRNSTAHWAGNQPALKLEQQPGQDCSEGGSNGFLQCSSVSGGSDASAQQALGGGAAHSSTENAPSDVQPAAPLSSGGGGAGLQQLGAAATSEKQPAEAAAAAAASRSTGLTPQLSAAAEPLAQAKASGTAGSQGQLESAAGTVNVIASSSGGALPQRNARRAERNETNGSTAYLQLLAVSREDGPSAPPVRAASWALPTLLSDLAPGKLLAQTSSAALESTRPAAATMHGVASSKQQQHGDSAHAYSAVLTGKTATGSSDAERVVQPVDGLAGVLSREGQPATVSRLRDAALSSLPMLQQCCQPQVQPSAVSRLRQAGLSNLLLAAVGQLVSDAQQPGNGRAAPGQPLSNCHRAASNEGMVTSAKHATLWLAPGIPSWCSLRWLLMLGAVLMAILSALAWVPAPQASPVASSSTVGCSREQVRHPSLSLRMCWLLLCYIGLHATSQQHLKLCATSQAGPAA